MEDIDLEYIASYIAQKSERNSGDIYEDLELLYNSMFRTQFIYLVERLLNYETADIIIDNLKGKKCYDFVITYGFIKKQGVKLEKLPC